MNSIPLASPDATAFIVVMSPQPDGNIPIVKNLFRNDWGYDDTRYNNTFIPPYAIGESVYLQEEWRVDKLADLHPVFNSTVLVTVLYGPDEPKYFINQGELEFKISHSEASKLSFRVGFNSASTMPSWAARHIYTISTISAKRYQDLTEDEQMDSDTFDSSDWDEFNENYWGWYTTVEPAE